MLGPGFSLLFPALSISALDGDRPRGGALTLPWNLLEVQLYGLMLIYITEHSGDRGRIDVKLFSEIVDSQSPLGLERIKDLISKTTSLW